MAVGSNYTPTAPLSVVSSGFGWLKSLECDVVGSEHYAFQTVRGTKRGRIAGQRNDEVHCGGAALNVRCCGGTQSGLEVGETLGNPARKGNLGGSARSGNKGV